MLWPIGGPDGRGEGAGAVKAVIRHVYGPPEVLEVAEVEKPAPGKGEVLVRIRATSVNASDWEILRKSKLASPWGSTTKPFMERV